MLAGWLPSSASRPPMTNEIDMRAIHPGGRNERFEHGMRALGGASLW